MTKEQIVEEYYKNNAKKLHKMIDSILKKFGGLSSKDYSDFYSIANEIFMKVLNKYDSNSKTSFNSYLLVCLNNAFKTEITKRNRLKNGSGKKILSLDVVLPKTDGKSFAEYMPSDFNTEEEVIEKKHLSAKMEKYLTSLTPLQKHILFLLADDYTEENICIKLNLTSKDCQKHIRMIQSYEKVKVLYTEE